jgi:hypothetical protein|tara:strand:- start:33475 stop:34065 length:591 start_codon:yes stop_codon:yes gene_type:complete
MIDLTPILAAVITAFATVASVLMGQRLMNRKQKDCVIRETSQNANVYTALQYIMEQMKADRGYILEFHNGEIYFSGRGQQKFSCTHEIVEEGISPESHNSQNHRVSNYHSYVNEIVTNGYFVYDDIRNIKDQGFYQMIKRKGIQSIYNVPIKTLDGKIIGILGVDYVKGPMPEQAHDDEINSFMRRQARTIAGYLI